MLTVNDDKGDEMQLEALPTPVHDGVKRAEHAVTPFRMAVCGLVRSNPTCVGRILPSDEGWSYGNLRCLATEGDMDYLAEFCVRKCHRLSIAPADSGFAEAWASLDTVATSDSYLN